MSSKLPSKQVGPEVSIIILIYIEEKLNSDFSQNNRYPE
jgi:hypothetical protein